MTTKAAKYSVRIYAGDQLIYQYSDSNFHRNDQMKSKLSCDARIPEQGKKGTVIKIIYQNGSNGIYDLDDILVGRGDVVMGFHVQQEIVGIVMIAIMFFLSFVALITGIYLKHFKLNSARFLNIAAFLALSRIWFLSDSALAQEYTSFPALTGMVSFYAFMLMSVPMVHFVKNTLDFEKYKILDMIDLLFYANALIEGILNKCLKIHMVQMLFVTHVLLFVAVITIVVLMIKEYRRTKDSELKIIMNAFGIMAVAGIFDIIFDLLSSILLVKSNPAYNSWMLFFSTMLYILQMIVVYIFFNYTQALRHCNEDIRTRNIKIMAVPILCMELAIVTNVFHKQFFYCNAQGQYVHGKAYLVTYIFTLICIAVVIINCFINQEEYQKDELRAIKEFLGVALICVTVQMKFQSLLMTGFGLSLGITILFWALYNPQLYIDSLTGSYSKGYFRRWFPEQIKRKRELHLLMIDLWKLKQVNKLYGVTTGDELLIQIAKYLHKINEANHVFRIHGNRFFVFTSSLMDYERNKDAIMQLFERPFKVKGERINFSAAICGIINVQEMKEMDLLIDYLEYLVQLKPKSDRTILI